MLTNEVVAFKLDQLFSITLLKKGKECVYYLFI